MKKPKVLFFLILCGRERKDEGNFLIEMKIINMYCIYTMWWVRENSNHYEKQGGKRIFQVK